MPHPLLAVPRVHPGGGTGPSPERRWEGWSLAELTSVGLRGAVVVVDKSLNTILTSNVQYPPFFSISLTYEVNKYLGVIHKLQSAYIIIVNSLDKADSLSS